MRPGGVGGERLAQNKRKAGCETGEGGKKERGKKKKMVGLLQFQGRMGGGRDVMGDHGASSVWTIPTKSINHSLGKY